MRATARRIAPDPQCGRAWRSERRRSATASLLTLPSPDAERRAAPGVSRASIVDVASVGASGWVIRPTSQCQRS